jgi:hypothetical protein
MLQEFSIISSQRRLVLSLLPTVDRFIGTAHDESNSSSVKHGVRPEQRTSKVKAK